MPPLSTTLLLTALLLLPLLILLLLPTLFPALRIRAITPISLHHLSYRPPSLRLDIARFGWSLRRQRNGWLVLRLSGVKLMLPRGFFASPRPSSRTTPPPTSRHSFGPVARRISEVLAPLVAVLAVEIEFVVELEGMLALSGIVSAGGEVGRSRAEGRRVGGWIALERLSIVELEKKGALPALEVREKVEVGGKALLGEGGVGGVELAVEFGEGSEGLHLRVHELGRVLESLEELRQAPTTTGRKDDATTPLSFLRSISLRLPLVGLSAHYHTPPHILASTPNRPLPLSVAFALTVRGVEGKLVMGGTTDGATVRREHVEWLGKGRELGVRAKFGWEEIEGRVKADGSEGSFFAVSSRKGSLTSFWTQRTSSPTRRRRLR